MADSDDQALWYALNRLVNEYWAEVDANGGVNAHEFYMPDALYVIGNNHFDGQAKIRAFYTLRGHGHVVTRHLISNVRVVRERPARARALGTMTLYRADDKSPFQGARPPAMIADFDADCVLGDDAAWRFQRHELRPFVVGSDMPASIMIKPQRLPA